MTRRRLPPLTALLGVALMACDAAGHHTSWTLRYDDPALENDATLLEALVLAGDCSGALLYRAEVPATGPGPEPPVLAAGRYGLAGLARDATCATIARGCVEVTLPLADGDRVVVPLGAADEPPACGAAQCHEGRCEGAEEPDAGFVPSDGGVERVDAGPPDLDAAPPDGGSVRVDAGPDGEDAGTTLEDGGAQCGLARAGRCYRHVAEPASWSDAEASCVSWGGHLVAYADATEEREVEDALDAGAHWIGLTDAIAEGSFLWVDGSPVTYTRWASEAPRASPPWRDCATYAAAGWLDERCTDPLPYVCER